MTKYLIFVLFSVCTSASAGNCLIQGDRKIGDCENVSVGTAKPLTITRSGSFSGNFGVVIVKAGAVASINGNADDILVEKRARLSFSGNASDIRVYGKAEINGNAEYVTAEMGSEVVIRGIVSGVSGDGKITKVKGAIVDGVYIR